MAMDGPGECFATQSDKDREVQAAEWDAGDAAGAAGQLPEIQKRYDELSALNDAATISNMTNSEYMSWKSKWTQVRWELDRVTQQANYYKAALAHLEKLKNRPICGAETTTAATVEPTSTSVDGSAGAAGAGTETDATSTTIVADDGTVTTLGSESTTTIEESTTTAVTDVTMTSVPEETTTTTEPVPEPGNGQDFELPKADKLVCDPPVLKESSPIDVSPGETFSITHGLCLDPTARFALSGAQFESAKADVTDTKVKWDLVLSEPGIYEISVFWLAADSVHMVSQETVINVYVFDETSGCGDKKPEIAVNVVSGDVTARSTCDEATDLLIWGTARNSYKQFAASTVDMEAGVNANFGDYMQDACFDVTARHATHNRRGFVPIGKPQLLIVGDCADAGEDPTTTTAASSGGGDTTTSTTMPDDGNSVVTALPVRILQPESNGARPLVVTIAKTAEELTCDSACLDAAASRAGISADKVAKVEVAFGDSAWAEVGDSFLVPMFTGGATVRLRITPESGEPKVMSARFVSGEIDEVAEGLVQQTTAVAPATGSQTVSVSTSSTSSFPWWAVVAAIVMILLLAVWFRIRKGSVNNGPQAG